MAKDKTGCDGRHYRAAHKDCFIGEGLMNVERQPIKELKGGYLHSKKLM